MIIDWRESDDHFYMTRPSSWNSETVI